MCSIRRLARLLAYVASEPRRTSPRPSARPDDPDPRAGKV